MLAAMTISSLKRRLVLILRPRTRMIIKVAAKLVHHQLNSMVGWSERRVRATGAGLLISVILAETVFS